MVFLWIGWFLEAAHSRDLTCVSVCKSHGLIMSGLCVSQ